MFIVSSSYLSSANCDTLFVYIYIQRWVAGRPILIIVLPRHFNIIITLGYNQKICFPQWKGMKVLGFMWHSFIWSIVVQRTKSKSSKKLPRNTYDTYTSTFYGYLLFLTKYFQIVLGGSLLQINTDKHQCTSVVIMEEMCNKGSSKQTSNRSGYRKNWLLNTFHTSTLRSQCYWDWGLALKICMMKI